MSDMIPCMCPQCGKVYERDRIEHPCSQCAYPPADARKQGKSASSSREPMMILHDAENAANTLVELLDALREALEHADDND